MGTEKGEKLGQGVSPEKSRNQRFAEISNAHESFMRGIKRAKGKKPRKTGEE